MIIAFVQTKGGTGKSTLALSIAFSERIHGEFLSVALVEMDPQGTLNKWWTRRENLGNQASASVKFAHISSTDKDVIQKELGDLEQTNDLLILDVPGESVGKFHTQFACAVADLVLIPMRTSTNDEEAFEDNLLPIIEKIRNVDNESENIFYIIPAFTHPLANKKKIYSYFKEIMPEYIPCFRATFSVGPVFENFSRAGNNLNEYAEMVKSNKKMSEQAIRAIEEVESIADEILKLR